jgi:hypothetical protein
MTADLYFATDASKIDRRSLNSHLDQAIQPQSLMPSPTHQCLPLMRRKSCHDAHRFDPKRR